MHHGPGSDPKQGAGSISKRSLAGNDRSKTAEATFSIIIPTLNEATTIPETLRHLVQFPEILEVLVVDGGSADDTILLAERAGARVLASAPGRGRQMNLGASVAQAPNLVFLHADCRLPDAAFHAMHEVFAQGHEAGVFSIDYGSPHLLLRLISRLSRLRTPWTEFGEATLFIRRSRFEAVGGFRDWPLMEDCEILSRLRRCKTLGKARAAVLSSPRRYIERGVVRQQLQNIALFGLFKMGIAPENLSRFYRPLR